MGNFFESGKEIRQQKERDRLRFFLVVSMIQWDSNPTSLRLLGYGKPLPYPLGGVCLEFFLLLMVSLVPSIYLWEKAQCRL